jgi:hypothetical protein
LAISTNLSQFKLNKGMIESQRAVWITHDHPRMGKIGLLGIYAANSTADQELLWQEIKDSIENSYKWIFLGNFNMIDAASNCKGGAIKLVIGAEKLAWV